MKNNHNIIEELSQSRRVIQVVSKLFIPFILLFAFYVQFHGDFGPGGGFQAGVIFASALILYGLVYGDVKTRSVMPPSVLRFLMSAGVLLYAGTGIASLFLDTNYLDYSKLASDSHAGQHWGIFLVELGVGLTVTAVMISLYYCFSSQRS